MKQFIKLFTAILFVSYALSSCKSKNEIGALVPADALAAGYFDTKSLLEKLPFSDIQNTTIFKDANDSLHIPSWGMKILEDPKKSGIDLAKGLVMYAQKDTGKLFNFVVSGFISSASDFEAFNKNIDPTQQVTDEKGIKTMILKNNSAAGWNDKKFVYVLNIENETPDLDELEGSTPPLPGLSMADAASARSYAAKAINLSSGNSLAGDERFINLLSKKGDMKAWINTEKIIHLSSAGVMGMFKLDDLIQDTRTAYSVTFNDGDVVADQYVYYGQKIADLIKKYKSDELKKADFESIPIQDVSVVMAFNINPQLLYEYLKLSGMDGLLGLVTSGMGMSTQELITSFDGKILATLGNIQLTNSDTPTAFSSPLDFDFLVKVGVKNKANVQKILETILSQTGGIVSANELPYSLTDNEYVYSNKSNLAKQFTDRQAKNNFEWADKLSGHHFGLYVDINKMLNQMPQPKDSAAIATLNASKAFWKDLYSVGGESNDKMISSETTIHLQDKGTNSLKQFNKYIDQLYIANRQKINQLKERETGLSTSQGIDSVELER